MHMVPFREQASSDTHASVPVGGGGEGAHGVGEILAQDQHVVLADEELLLGLVDLRVAAAQGPHSRLRAQRLEVRAAVAHLVCM